VGGVLATEASWRWAFLVMVPVALGGVVGVRATIGESREPGADRRLDVAGALLLMTGVGCIVFALQEGGSYGWWRAREADPLQAFAWTPAISPIPILLAVGVAALAALWIVEGRREATGWPVMLNRRLLGVRSFRDGELTVSTMSVAFYGSLLIIPIYTQFVLGYGALASGGIVFAIGGGIVVGGLAATWLSGRLGDRRAGLSAVALQAVAAIALAATVGHGPGWLLAFPLLVLGVGFGVALALLSGLLMSQVPAALASLAAGTSTTIRNVTQALGAALLTAVLLGTAVSDVRDRLDTMPAVSAADRRTIEQAADFSSNAPPLNRASGQGTQTIAELREEPALRPAIDALDGAFATATRTALGVSAGLAILALLIGLRIPRPEHDAATAPEARDAGAGAPESVGPPPASPGSRTGGDHPPSPEGR
jgi:predicted MFS family arabinose efflux permease